MSEDKKITINATDALNLLREAMRERGYDYVDPNSERAGCRNVEYVNGELKASCIVGTCLVNAGVPLDILENNPGSVNSTVRGLLSEMGPEKFEITTNAQVVFHVAQAAQDAGKMWGEAFDAADSVHSFFERGGVL